MAWKVKKVPATTNNITNGIINFLLSKGHSASRINTQGQFKPLTAGEFPPSLAAVLPILMALHLVVGRWQKSGSRVGYFDISGCINGRAVAFDVKKGNDKLSPEQLEFQREFRAAGGLAEEFATLGEFYDWYEKVFNSSFNTKNGGLH